MTRVMFRRLFKRRDKQARQVEAYKVAYSSMNQDQRTRYQERIEIESARDFFRNQDTINRCNAALEVIKEEKALAELADHRILH